MLSEKGYSVLELIAVLAIAGIVSAISFSNLRELSNPLDTGTAQVMSFLRHVRTRAVATTSAYKVTPLGNNQLRAQYAATCDSALFTNESKTTLELPTGVTFPSTLWSVCFSSRGLADGNTILTLIDSDGRSRSVEVYLGGAVRDY